MSFLRHEAIYNTHPNVASIREQIPLDIDGNPVSIDEVKVSQEIEKLNAKFKSTQYQRDRIYPSIEQQLDEIFHKGLDEWKKTIQAVKDKHPKPSE